MSNNESVIASYSSDTQYALARDSYGESDDLFLDPGSGAASTSETVLYYIGVGYASGCTSEMGSVSGSDPKSREAYCQGPWARCSRPLLL